MIFVSFISRNPRIRLDCFHIHETDFSFVSTSDQEPPYSMITLHEMAETGRNIYIWTFFPYTCQKRLLVVYKSYKENEDFSCNARFVS